MLRQRKKIKPLLCVRNRGVIKKGARVIILTGKDKKKISTVLEVKKNNEYVKVKGIKMETHYHKDDGVRRSSIDLEEGWIHISNVANVTKDGQGTKVKIIRKDGIRKLFSKKTGEEIIISGQSPKVKVEEEKVTKDKEAIKKEAFEEEKMKKEGVVKKKRKVTSNE